MLFLVLAFACDTLAPVVVVLFGHLASLVQRLVAVESVVVVVLLLVFVVFLRRSSSVP